MKLLEFEEIQRFTDNWIGKILAVSMLVGLVMMGVSLTAQPNPSMLLGFLLLLLGNLIFMVSRLRTHIDSSGIRYQFQPFHHRERFIPWADVAGSAVRRYSPLREFGGWGVRFGPHGRAFSVTGNQGLQLVLKKGRQILIGTQRPHDLQDVLRRLHEVV